MSERKLSGHRTPKASTAAAMKNRGKSPVLTASTASNASAPGSASGGGGGRSSGQHHHQYFTSASSQRGSVSGRSESGAPEALLGLPSSVTASNRPASDVGAGFSSAPDGEGTSSPNHRGIGIDQHDDSTTSAGAGARDHGNSIFYDDPEAYQSLYQGVGGTPDPELTQKAISATQAKMEKLRELISEEQKTMDDNVNEYLKLYSSADDRQQQNRIKQLFEKKNQKSAQTIAQQQKKLEEYKRKVSDLHEHGLRPKSSHKLGQGLKSVRDGVESVMSKPKELATKLRHKFGSADNLSQLSKDSDPDSSQAKKQPENRNHLGSASLPRENSGGIYHHASTASSSSAKHRKCISDDGRRSERSAGRSVGTAPDDDEDDASSDSDSDSEHPEVAKEASKSSPQRGGHHHNATSGEEVTSAEWKTVMQELTLQKEENDHLREEMEELRQQFKLDLETLTYQLREDRERFDRLEEQMNDMIELHQHEVENIKSGVGDMEEKVQYQSEERLLDIKEHLQTLETKVTSMEHQAAQQQYLNFEGMDNTDARAVLMKLLSAAITVVHVLLFFVATLMTAARPFVRTSPRLAATTLVVFVAVWTYYKQEDILAAYHAKFGGGVESDAVGGGGFAYESVSSSAASSAAHHSAPS